MQDQSLTGLITAVGKFGHTHALQDGIRRLENLNRGWRMKDLMNLASSKSASISAIVLSAALALPLAAQTTQTPAAPPQASSEAATANPSPNPNEASTSATGQPLAAKSNEGFWGRLNPWARKKWVRRQVAPINDRLNELDEISAKQANDIKDVDARAQAGIHKAQNTADQANQEATQANNQADHAQDLAQQATTQTAELNRTVENIDRYQKVADMEIHFRRSQTSLDGKAKLALDQVASQLQGQKGYIVEVQGYSNVRGQAGVQRSQTMADAVVRYLVVDHNVPLYKIYRVAMGNAPRSDATESRIRGTVVYVSLMHNSLAALNTPVNGQNGGSPIGATQQTPVQPSPRDAASQPQQ